MSGPSSPRVGGFAGMLSSILNMSWEELEKIGQAIGQAVLARRESRTSGLDSQQPDPSTLDVDPSSHQSQSAEPDDDIPDDFDPTDAELKEINRVVLEKDDSPMNSEEAEGEERRDGEYGYSYLQFALGR